MSNEGKFASQYNDPLAWYQEGLDKSKGSEIGITAEAIDKVRNDRQKLYGHPATNFKRIAEMWSTYLDHKVEITVHDVAWMMILLKVAREIETPHRDNRTDVVGYIECLELTDEVE